jgi:hypothetical protein
MAGVAAFFAKFLDLPHAAGVPAGSLVGPPEHARNYNADPAAYPSKVTAFLDRGLPK